MASRNSGICTYDGLMSQNLTGTIGGDSYYACGFLSNYTRAVSCCSPESVHEFGDPCYSWCDLPPSMNSQIDLDEDFSMLDYMKGCLNQTGETIGPLWCRLTQPHVITLPKTTTEEAIPTSTFDSAEYCATADPQTAISVNDPWAACGMLPTNPNHLAFEACCQPAPAQWTVQHCFEYCYLPRGNKFRGLRDSRNMTDDQILGSFKTCMIDEVGDESKAYNGLWCRVNETAIDLKARTFQTTEYMTGGPIVSGAVTGVRAWTVLCVATALCLLAPMLMLR